MATVFAVYTGQGLQPIVQELFRTALPGHRLVNLIDDGLIGEVIASNGVTPSIRRRLLRLFEAASASGADVILNTCSSVGEIVPMAEPFIGTPILRIDQPMADMAVQFARVGVLATLSTTLEPSMRLIQERAALAGRSVQVVSGLADGAFQALQAGDAAGHDRILLETAMRLAGEVDALVLAQGSMTRMLAELKEKAGIPVLASPPNCMDTLKKMVENLK